MKAAVHRVPLNPHVKGKKRVDKNFLGSRPQIWLPLGAALPLFPWESLRTIVGYVSSIFLSFLCHVLLSCHLILANLKAMLVQF